MGSCEEHRSRPYIWCGLHSCEIVACLQARTWLLSRGPWWPWVAWLWQRAMGATKETPTGSTSKFELVTLWKVAQTKEGFISALRNDTVDWEMCVCFVCVQEGPREQKRLLRRTAGRRQKHHRPANGHKCRSISSWNDGLRPTQADHQQQPLNEPPAETLLPLSSQRPARTEKLWLWPWPRGGMKPDF